MAAIARYYSSTAVTTTLADSIGSADTSIRVASNTGFPQSYPFTLILEKDTANEEIVTVTALVGVSYTVTRGVDSTAARAHSVGAAVDHGVSALDFTAFRAHEAAGANVHDIGASSSVVGTLTTQTISNKTLGSNLAAGGFKITGLADPTSAQDAATKAYADLQAPAAAASAAAAAASATAAASSASAASSSAASAAASFDSFDDRYLGAKASNPTLDNDGNALLTGALFFDTTNNLMKVWTGSQWNAAAADSSAFIQKSDYNAKGKILVGTGVSTFTSLSVGSDTFVLIADSTTASGVKWAELSVGLHPFLLMGA